MNIAIPALEMSARRLFLGVEQFGDRPRLARPARRARRGARARHRAAPRHCRNCWRACSPGAASRSTTCRGLPRSDRASADARSVRADRHGRGGGAHRRRGRCAARASRSSATTTSTARPRRRCWRASCGTAGLEPIDPHPRPACSKATARTSRRSARSPSAARRCSSPSIAAPPAIEPLAEAARLGLDVVVIDHHLADEELPPALAVVNPNRLDDLSGLGHLAAVGLVFMTRGGGEPRAARARLLERGAAGARPARPARPGRARHRRRRGAAATGSTAPSSPRDCWRCAGASMSGLTALMDVARLDRPAGAVSSRLPARAAHQCRRPHRPRRSRRAAAARRTIRSRPARIAAELDRLNGERQAIEVATLAQAEAEAMAALGIEEKGAVVVTAARRLASRRGRAGRGAAEGALRPAGLCHRARAGRHRHRLGPLDRRRRSRPRGAAGGARRACCSRAAATPWRPASRLRKDALAAFRAFLEETLGDGGRRRRGATTRSRSMAR